MGKAEGCVCFIGASAEEAEKRGCGAVDLRVALHSLTPEPVPESEAVPKRGGAEGRSFAENTGMGFHRRVAESLRKTQRKKEA